MRSRRNDTILANQQPALVISRSSNHERNHDEPPHRNHRCGTRRSHAGKRPPRARYRRDGLRSGGFANAPSCREACSIFTKTAGNTHSGRRGYSSSSSGSSRLGRMPSGSSTGAAMSCWNCPATTGGLKWPEVTFVAFCWTRSPPMQFAGGTNSKWRLSSAAVGTHDIRQRHDGDGGTSRGCGRCVVEGSPFAFGSEARVFRHHLHRNDPVRWRRPPRGQHESRGQRYDDGDWHRGKPSSLTVMPMGPCTPMRC